MDLSEKEIERIASLARIALSESEKQSLGKELSAVIGYFEKLRQLDTASVDLNLAETETENSSRQDESADSGLQAAILANAPVREGRFIKVKSVL